MKKLLILIILVPVITFAQYNQEVTTEESFESSDLFFESHYLNTFGMKHFNEVATGFINDPFLNLYLNPANLPDLDKQTTLIYLGFAGDRDESEIVGVYPQPYYYDYAANYMPTQDLRWLTNSRQESAPIISLGLLTYPLSESDNDFFIGGTYQLVHKTESFYTVPYYIYNSRYYYDAFGNGVMPTDGSYPIIDRYSGNDEMTTTAHMFSAFAGYRISDNFNAGISINGVIHSRDGSYLNQSQDEYGNIDYYDWANYSLQERNQDYSHYDLSAGINYKINSVSNIGIKAGTLTGTAEQVYTSQNDYFSDYNNPAETDRLNDYMSNSLTYQQWKEEGTNYYLSLIFNRQLKENVSLTAYYRYTNGSIDHNNCSTISDTSNYYYKWDDTYYNYSYENYGSSATHDIRTGSGEKITTHHEAAVNLHWEVTESISFSTGTFFGIKSNEINSVEPVISTRYSEYYYNNTNPQEDYNSSYLQSEDKILNWQYESDYWTLQIPLMMNFKLNDNITWFFGLNKILRNWDVKNSTVAYFNYRDRIENGIHTREENFGERYQQPTKHYSENVTDFSMGLKVVISEELKINLFVNPEFDNAFRFSQWQLSFYGQL